MYLTFFTAFSLEFLYSTKTVNRGGNVELRWSSYQVSVIFVRLKKSVLLVYFTKYPTHNFTKLGPLRALIFSADWEKNGQT